MDSVETRLEQAYNSYQFYGTVVEFWEKISWSARSLFHERSLKTCVCKPRQREASSSDKFGIYSGLLHLYTLNKLGQPTFAVFADRSVHSSSIGTGGCNWSKSNSWCYAGSDQSLISSCKRAFQWSKIDSTVRPSHFIDNTIYFTGLWSSFPFRPFLRALNHPF